MAWDPKTFEYYDDGSQFDLARAQRPPEDRSAPWAALNPLPIVELAAHAMVLAQECESPIEVQLGAELRAQAVDRFIIVPQFEWRCFRIDFAISSLDMEVLALVECDGAAFHSTAAQIANDRRKDKAAEAAGIPMYRFTGSEIFRNAKACAALVLWGCR